MITDVRRGDLFDSSAQTLVNTVNTVGVMGKGVALAFKRRFPEMFADYQRRCRAGEVRLGEPYLWRGLVEPWVINFPTKDHWRSLSRLVDIERGLIYLSKHITEWDVASLAVPPLGAGSGGLDWATVGPTILSASDRLRSPQSFTPRSKCRTRKPTWSSLRLEHRFASQPQWPPRAWLDRSRRDRAAGRRDAACLADRTGTAARSWRTSLMPQVYGPGSPFWKPAMDRMPTDSPSLSRLINNGVLVESRVGRMLTAGRALHSTTRSSGITP